MKTKVAPIVVLGGALVGFVLLLSIIRSISFHSLSRPSYYIIGNLIAAGICFLVSYLVSRAKKIKGGPPPKQGKPQKSQNSNDASFSRQLQFIHLFSKEWNSGMQSNSSSASSSSTPTGDTKREKEAGGGKGKGKQFASTGIAHTFVKKHFDRPTWCNFCGRFLWGLGKQGFGCKQGCGYAAHSECARELQMGHPDFFTCRQVFC